MPERGQSCQEEAKARREENRAERTTCVPPRRREGAGLRARREPLTDTSADRSQHSGGEGGSSGRGDADLMRLDGIGRAGVEGVRAALRGGEGASGPPQLHHPDLGNGDRHRASSENLLWIIPGFFWRGSPRCHGDVSQPWLVRNRARACNPPATVGDRRAGYGV
ncbi:hypothetical protein SKAU_G00399510 [Synaphobranchus kaupii]|uniref:Uncharacterized protein n=1 Tax=Synaphobranchus kaupii TaxID=118154 RepID=A0A9Q1E8V3_SYNKA|nr:hypothetical protein SKAU_G00399510 [Synaphobranchus kaupii]